MPNLDNSTNFQNIFIFEPEGSLLGIYLKYFLAKNYFAQGFADLDALENALESMSPKILVMSLPQDSSFEKVFSKILFFKEKFQSLPVISYSYELPHEHLKKLLNAGVNSHVDRKFSRPRDLVELTLAILN